MRVLRISHSAALSEWRERERELARRGADVELLTARDWEAGGLPVHFVPGSDVFAHGVRTVGRHPNVFVYDPRPLWRALHGDWDVIDIHEEPCSLATAEVLLLRSLARARAPFTLYSAQNIEKRYPIPFRWFERHALRRAAAVSVCNHEAGEILYRKGLAGPATEIPLGVDVDAFHPANRLAPGPERLHIGYVGRLEPHKGVGVVIDALVDLSGAVLDIVGAGSDETVLRDRAERAGVADRVRFRGAVAAESLPDVYREFDVLVVPSLPTSTWLEQFGRVAVEAMASGVPVIASRSGALPDVIGAAGVLVEPGDVAAWTGAIADLWADQPRWSALRRAGLEAVTRFAWPAVVDGLQAMYRTATGVAPDPLAASGDPEIVVVAYGPADKLERALRALGGDFPVLVVDNSGNPETERVVRECGGRYLNPGANLGFAAGVNYALARRIDPDRDVVLLNPDAEIAAEDVRRLHAALRSDERLAAVAPAQVDLAGHAGRVRWPFPTPGRAWLEAVGLGRIETGDSFLIGAVLVLSAAALREIGPFDERFFLYSEETDWQRRALDAGWRLRLVDGVQAMHEGAGTGGDSSWRVTVFTASLELYVRKHAGRLGWAAFRAAGIAGAAGRSVLLPRAAARARARTRLSIYLRGPARLGRAAGRPGSA